MLNVKQLHKTSHKNRKTQITDKLKARQTSYYWPGTIFSALVVKPCLH